ncbi:CPK1, partial [Symbiodinium sp. KB8]
MDITVTDGSNAKVYSVHLRDAPHDGTRAAKVIDIAPSDQATNHRTRTLKGLLTEVDLWQHGGHHAGIVKLFEVFVGANYFAAIMEECGPSLLQRVHEIGRMKAADVARILKQMLQPICHLHDLQIVHRDIKPENFLFEHAVDRSRVKLCDFGMAAKVPMGGLLRGRFGTLPYMSPEMVSRSGHSFATDVWSFGASAYFLLFQEFVYMPACPHRQRSMEQSIRLDYPRPRFLVKTTELSNETARQ